MRLLLVYSTAASNVFFSKIAAAFAQEGIEVFIVCNTTSGQNEEFPTEARIYHLGMKRGVNPVNTLFASRTLSRLVSDLKPDVIHAHFAEAMLTAALARRSDWPPLIGTFHGLFNNVTTGSKKVFASLAESFIAHRLRNIVVLNRSDKEALEAWSPRVRTFMAGEFGLGASIEQFDPSLFSLADRDGLREHYGIPRDAPLAIWVGRMVDFKGFHITIRAFRRITRDYPAARLICLGEPDPKHPTGLTGEELSWARNHSAITFTGYRLDVAKYHHASDFMVFPSGREGMPLCLMEAMSMGLPCITADSRGCNEIVDNGINGLVVPFEDVEATTAAWVAMVRDPALRQSMGEKAREKRQRFDWRIAIREHIGLYQRLIGERGQAGGGPAGKS